MVYMYHSFLIHSSADGHLGCSHVLAVINSSVMKIEVQVPHTSWLIYLGLELPGHVVTLFNVLRN